MNNPTNYNSDLCKPSNRPSAIVNGNDKSVYPASQGGKGSSAPKGGGNKGPRKY